MFELAKRKVVPVPSESAVYRALLRAGLIDPSLRDRRSRKWNAGNAACRWSYGRRMLSADSRWPTAAALRRSPVLMIIPGCGVGPVDGPRTHSGGL